MSRRAAILGAAAAAVAVGGGVAGSAVLRRRRRPDPEADEPLSELPPDDLGPVRSFDGTDLNVRAAGDPSAPPLLFVHGFSLDLTAWHYQWKTLCDRFRCVLLDLRAHGRSAQAEDLSLSAMAHDVAAGLEAAADSRRAVVVAHSMGAMSVIAMATSRPELLEGRVAGMVLAGAAASDLLRGAMGSVTEMLRPRVGSLGEALQRVDRLRRHVVASRTDVAALVARLTQFGTDPSPHLVEHVVGLAARSPSKVWTDGLAGLMEMDLRHALDRIRVPVLVVVGEHDRVTPPAAAVELAGALPQGRLEIVKGAGHMAMLERHDAFNELVGVFAGEVLEPRIRAGRRKQEDRQR